jgi:hypothetical protein
MGCSGEEIMRTDIEQNRQSVNKAKAAAWQEAGGYRKGLAI